MMKSSNLEYLPLLNSFQNNTRRQLFNEDDSGYMGVSPIDNQPNNGIDKVQI